MSERLHPMESRTVLIRLDLVLWLLLIAAVFSGLIGWSLRVHTMDDIYYRNMAEMYQAEKAHYQREADAIVGEARRGKGHEKN